MTSGLEAQSLTAFYGQFQALFGLDIYVRPGECVAIIGANGAGKTTLMRSLSGVISQHPDQVLLDGEPIGHLSADAILRLGVSMVPEGRRLFPSLTVEENLLIGGDHVSASGAWSLETVYRMFPILKDRRTAPGTSLSGGQQQMVAIGRALMSNPRFLLCDELSLGLAPAVIKDIYDALPIVRETGTAVVVVEQDVSRALSVADRVYCLMEGRVTLSGSPSAFSQHEIHMAYFGDIN